MEGSPAKRGGESSETVWECPQTVFQQASKLLETWSGLWDSEDVSPVLFSGSWKWPLLNLRKNSIQTAPAFTKSQYWKKYENSVNLPFKIATRVVILILQDFVALFDFCVLPECFNLSKNIIISTGTNWLSMMYFFHFSCSNCVKFEPACWVWI